MSELSLFLPHRLPFLIIPDGVSVLNSGYYKFIYRVSWKYKNENLKIKYNLTKKGVLHISTVKESSFRD